jgi:hypothetical protein
MPQKYIAACHIIRTSTEMPPADLKLPLFSKHEMKRALHSELAAKLGDDDLLLIDASLVEEVFRV